MFDQPFFTTPILFTCAFPVLPFPIKNKVSLLTYLCSDEQLFYVALVFQNDTNIDFFRKFSKSLGSAAELRQAFFQMIVH